MKLLRDVAKRSTPRPYPWPDDDEYDEDGDENHGYWGEAVGRVACCGWNYSQRAYDDELIRHRSDCSNFNPQGLNEF